MKFKTTKKVIQSRFNCVSIGYCSISYLTRGIEPIAYTCGVYGWNADIYEIDGVALVTGYRPFGIETDHELTQKYENKARDLYNKYPCCSWSVISRKLDKLRSEYIKKLKESLAI